MHLCERCDEARDLIPLPDGGARCPQCGWTDPSVRVGPVLLVTGASGSGKSTLLPLLLARLAAERVVVVDVDWLIDPLARAGGGDVDWDAFRDVWLQLAHAVTQNGLVPVLLGPFFPAQLDGLPGRTWIGQVHALLLDCDDESRRARIQQRPGWRARDIDAQVEFGQALRRLIPRSVDTTDEPVEATADAVVAWVRAQI